MDRIAGLAAHWSLTWFVTLTYRSYSSTRRESVSGFLQTSHHLSKMGAGASAGIQETVIASSEQELKDAIAGLADADRKKLIDAIKDSKSGE